MIAEEIADDLQAALEQFATIATDLRPRGEMASREMLKVKRTLGGRSS